MTYTADTEDYKGFTIKIIADEDVGSPRKEFDHFGTMVCFHSRYDLGDLERPGDPGEWLKALAVEFQPYVDDLFELWENEGYTLLRQTMTHDKASDHLVRVERSILFSVVKRHCMIMPLYLLDHSGLRISTGNFLHVDPGGWDSGQVGWIYVTNERIKKEFNFKEITEEVRLTVRNILKGEVSEYDDFLSGNVWGYVIEDEFEDEIDSCWGFYGDYDNHDYGALIEARKQVDYLAAKRDDELADLRLAETAGEVVMY